MVKEINENDLKKQIARTVLEDLPEWFGIPEAREEYISNSEKELMLVFFIDDVPVGFLTLKETGKATVELAVIGVLKEYHRKGIGKALVEEAFKICKAHGYSFIQVKTVKMGCYKEYDDTNLFYLSLGFQEFELFPNLWDEWNPCQIYVRAL